MAKSNIQEKLQSLLVEAEHHQPGSAARTQSLEQIRSMLLDRGSTMKNSSSPKEIGGDSMMRSAFSMGAAVRTGISPDGDSVLLDDSVFHSHHDTSLHSIPEAGHHSGSIWNESAYPDEHVHDDSFSTLGGTFMMDDVDVPSHTHPTSIPMPSSSSAASRPPINEPPLQGGVSVAAPYAPPAAALPAARAVTAVVGKPPAVPASPSRGSGKPSAKATGQMSNLAKEEQALIPHLPAGTLGGTAAPLVPMQLEPEKRLSHKEVEQRRREKAKQYFDELRALLPFGGDSAKFDKNAILHHSIILLKNLMAELAQEEASAGTKPTPGQAGPADYHCSFDVNRQPLCFSGLDSRLTDANSAFCTLSGYSRMEVMGLSLLNSTAAADLETAQQHWTKLSQPGNAQAQTSYKCRLVRKDGQQIMCNIDLCVVMKQNKPSGFIISANPSA